MAADRWAHEQVRALVALGEDLQDATEFVLQARALLPLGADSETYIPTDSQLDALATITDGDLVAARRDWYTKDSVPQQFKMILDAQEPQS